MDSPMRLAVHAWVEDEAKIWVVTSYPDLHSLLSNMDNLSVDIVWVYGCDDNWREIAGEFYNWSL